MKRRFIYPISRRNLPDTVGEKANNLQRLNQKGFLIPKSYGIAWDLQEAYSQNGDCFPASFLQELKEVLDPNTAYAVRSSANVEDAQDLSYAGQFHSELEVRGIESILDAVRAVWGTTQDDAPRSYQIRQHTEEKEIKMGLVLQEMIPSQCSGVAFSRNPITGMDEIVVEAIPGSGVALVQDGITPDRWIWKWGKWLQKPEISDISQDLIQDIVLQVRDISLTFGFPVDLEWVFDGQRLFWLQMRAITTLQSVDVYANHIPKEFLPGVIKPLVWSVNVPLVNGAWVRLLTELIGENQLDPMRLARSFYGYAYFNMGLIGSIFQKIGLPDNALERLMGFEAEGDSGPSFQPSLKALRYLPRLVKFILEKNWFDKEFEAFFASAQEEYKSLEAANLQDLKNNELLDHIDTLYSLNQKTAYFNIITPLLMQFYHQWVKGRMAKNGLDYERINWLKEWREREDYDPLPHLRHLSELYQELDTSEKEAIVSTSSNSPSHTLEKFKDELGAFLGRFGHLSDNGNDFSYPLWTETPETVFNLIEGFADDSFLVKTAVPANLEDSQAPEGLLQKRAIRFSQNREQVSFLYTRGMSMFRGAYLSVGERFNKLGWLENNSDIFYLAHDEIVSAINRKEAADGLKELVKTRREDYSSYESISLPPIIYGENPPPILDKQTTTLIGIPTSRGVHRGIVRVVKGVSDFQKVSDDCVLVIPYSDISWTPLFSRAGAVVAEAGGLLSHSSIVAREYGIPAIVSVPDATHLEDGIEVTVDGYSGNIILHGSGSAEQE